MVAYFIGINQGIRKTQSLYKERFYSRRELTSAMLAMIDPLTSLQSTWDEYDDIVNEYIENLNKRRADGNNK